MRLLFVEDEKEKNCEISSFLNSFGNIYNIDNAYSIMGALKALHKDSYDAVLLDMSLPLYDAGVNDENNEFETFGGLYILDEVERLDLESFIIVITAFDIIDDGNKKVGLGELDVEMNNDYPKKYKGCILYDHSSLEWKEKLTKWLNR